MPPVELNAGAAKRLRQIWRRRQIFGPGRIGVNLGAAGPACGVPDGSVLHWSAVLAGMSACVRSRPLHGLADGTNSDGGWRAVAHCCTTVAVQDVNNTPAKSITTADKAWFMSPKPQDADSHVRADPGALLVGSIAVCQTICTALH